MFGNHDMPIGDEQPENTPSQRWNASRVFNPLLQLAQSITGAQPARHSSSSTTFPPLTPADLPASYTYRTTWPDFTFVRALVYHFPLRSRRFFNAGIHLRVAALGCRPWVVARRNEKQSYCVDDDNNEDLTASNGGSSSTNGRSTVAGLYLSTEPLPSPSLDYGLWLPIPQRIVFQVRAVGQGWVRDGGGEDVLDGRHAWFEASILTPVIGFAGLATEGATLQDVLAGETWETPVQARGALMKQGWDFVEREDGDVVWKVCNSVTTSGRYQDCRVEWKRGVEMQVEDGSGVGKGDGFLERLTSGYIVVFWARAEVSFIKLRQPCLNDLLTAS
ncbi:hypothetical protein DIS24_g9581 [Lasiodiplodia hormozganensis]|uniref:Uncharacterized protein n=1 Tax=Lasiodiplodia hormozganensis TaxID=869390 RepID=A0AA39XU22_9PEZI|nr:hypothetical protein DIS24_g9581 [Lasiodiplodia hormozganensis]